MLGALAHSKALGQPSSPCPEHLTHPTMDHSSCISQTADPQQMNDAGFVGAGCFQLVAAIVCPPTSTKLCFLQLQLSWVLSPSLRHRLGKNRTVHPGRIQPRQQGRLSITGQGVHGHGVTSSGSSSVLPAIHMKPSMLPKHPGHLSVLHATGYIPMQRSLCSIESKEAPVRGNWYGRVTACPHVTSSAQDATKCPQQWSLMLCAARHRMLHQQCNTQRHPRAAPGSLPCH